MAVMTTEIEAVGVGREQGPGEAMVWGAFLGASWTWVIGMFFPVLLVRDYGVWGWVAFAVPNVLGAAAMGFVLSAERAASLWRRHRGAVRWFSDITLGFHVFVLCWLGVQLFGPAAWLAIAAGAVMLPVSRRLSIGPWLPGAAVVVSLVSFGCFVVLGRTAEAWSGVWPSGWMEWAGLDGAMVAADGPRLSAVELWLFVPASVTGFLLCPYLDGSFLRARAATGKKTGRWAFALGFGVVFFSNIVFALMYAGLLVPAFGGKDVELPVVWQVLLGVHVCVQACFTVAVHVRERMTLDPEGRSAGWLAGVVAAAIVLVLLQHRVDGRFGEWGYRGFLLFYGIVFPGYVFIVMLCGRGSGRMVWAWVTPVALVLGGYAFIGGEMWFLPGAMGLIALGGAVSWFRRG